MFTLAWERDIYMYIYVHIYTYIFFFSLCIFRALHPGSSPVRLCGRHVVFLSFFWLNYSLSLSFSLFASREIETYHSTQIQVYTLTDMHTLYIVHWVYALPPLPSLLNGAAQLFHWYNTIIHSQKLLTQPQLVSSTKTCVPNTRHFVGQGTWCYRLQGGHATRRYARCLLNTTISPDTLQLESQIYFRIDKTRAYIPHIRREDNFLPSSLKLTSCRTRETRRSSRSLYFDQE